MVVALATYCGNSYVAGDIRVAGRAEGSTPLSKGRCATTPMDASVDSASMREICRDALEKPNKSSEGRCVLEAGHFACYNRGLERFQGIPNS